MLQFEISHEISFISFEIILNDSTNNGLPVIYKYIYPHKIKVISQHFIVFLTKY